MSIDDGLLSLYRTALRGDLAVFADAAFAALGREIAFDAGMLVTSLPDRPAFLDAHFTGFPDVPALMDSWREVSHLDALAPSLIAEPGRARRHDIDDALIAGPTYAPLRAHLERFEFLHSLCVALAQPDSPHLVVVILVRRARGARATDAELAQLAAMGPAVAEAHTACRSMALLRSPHVAADQMCVARIDPQGAFVQTTPAFVQAMWGGAAPQQVHLAADVRQALARGQAWPVPGRGCTLYGLPDGGGWVLSLRPSSRADALSAREREIAQRFARGETNKQVAQVLGVSPATVRNHLSNIYDKLGVSHRAGLIEALTPGALP